MTSTPVMGLNGEIALHAEDVTIGWLPGAPFLYKRRLLVTVSVRMEVLTRQPAYMTVTHELAERPLEFALTTGIWRPGRSDILQGGATAEPLLDDDLTLAPGFTPDDIRMLASLHERWHLNSLRAGCAHQPEPAIPDGVPRDKQTAWLLDNVPPCPEAGYRWGSSWLLEPLPACLTPDYVRTLLHLG